MQQVIIRAPAILHIHFEIPMDYQDLNKLFSKEQTTKLPPHRIVLILFLMYNIDTTGVSMDQKKVGAVLNWSTSRTEKELQRFLGLKLPLYKELQYYRCHTNITHKGNKKNFYPGAKTQSKLLSICVSYILKSSHFFINFLDV